MNDRRTLPRGTVTFLFTDIEGSTRLLDALRDGYPAVLQRHREVLVGVAARHGGLLFGTEGDALFIAFERATSAVAAAVEGQQALSHQEWPPGVALRVRMGMHTGEADVLDGDYVGMAVHVAARVAAAGHGGQILLTDVTARLGGDPEVIDLGVHRLKDVGELRLLQVVAPELEAEFPPLRTLSAMPNNLPAAVDTFVGRRHELLAITSALSSSRLVTLTGPGGSGKTRLALEAAAGLLPTFADGVWFVPLATLQDGDRVVPTVAQTMRVGDRAGESVTTALEEWLRDRDLLLVLDNCEHLVDAAGAFCDRFLSTCRHLRVLATSREFLGVRGEHAIRTPPLAVPEDRDAACDADAVRLFLTRAAAAAPGFDPTQVDVDAVVRICRRLDGLPLAIELAAARLRALSIEQISSRLDDRFRLLTGGNRADLPRHRTLQAVVTWSYELLSEEERQLFARLAVFPHHFTLEMAEAVTAAPPVAEGDVIELLTRLVEKSLVTTVNAADGLRYQLLETLRQYGTDRLIDGGEVDVFRERVLEWAMAGVQRLEAAMRTPAMDDAIRDATLNAVTYRSASEWAAAHDRPVDALRIATAVPLGLHKGERRAEILALLAAAEAAGDIDDVVAGQAWMTIGNLAFEQSDWEASVAAQARGVVHLEAAGERVQAAWARYLAAHAAWGAGEVSTVDALVADAMARFREAGDDMGLGYCLWLASLRTGDLAAARDMAAEADGRLRRAGAPMGIAHNVEGRGIIALDLGDLDHAAAFVAEAVGLFTSYGNLGCAAHAIEAAAVVLSTAGHQEVAAALVTAAEDFRQRSGQGHRPWEVRGRPGSIAARWAVLDACTQRSADHRPHVLSATGALAMSALGDICSAGTGTTSPAR